jgi:excisionase family DNA binding protein
MAEPLHTVDEVMAMLRTGRSTIYALTSSGALRSIRVGRGIRIPESAVQEFLDKGGEARARGAN